MKTGIVTTLIALCLPVSVFATTLRLSTDVDLLVLDGKKVSSSLLRGADSIELDNGPHQLVFRVEKTIHLSNSEERPQDRYCCKTPLEVRQEALKSDIPVEYPIPENKRIKKYKEKWCA